MPDGALAGYLGAARAILAAPPLRGDGHTHAAALPGQLGWLRWFELPAACLTPPRAG